MSASTFIQERSASLLVLSLLSSSYVLYLLVRRLVIARRHSVIIKANGCKPVPSYPHKDPIFGLDIFSESKELLNSGGLLEKIQERYRITCRSNYTFSQLFLGKRIISTAEPENIKAILATKFKDFQLPDSRKDALSPIYGHGIFTTDSKEWEASRALLRPNFTRSHVGDLDVFEGHISKMISKIPQDGSTVDLQELFFMLTLDSATDFLFGSSTNVLGSGQETIKGQKFAEAFTYANERAGLEGRVGKLATILPDQKFKDAVNYIHEYIGSYVQQAVQQSQSTKEKSSPERYIFLDELAKVGHSERKIQDELLNILLAGRDTTAGLLAHLFYILARRPDVWKKLREEVLRLGDERPTFEQIKEMKYLQYCLNETLRLYPVVPANGRVAVNDTFLPVGGGADGKSPVFLSKGTIVFYHVYVMHRRKDLYGEDANEFRPERWETLRPSWQFLPFNGGPRICIGQQFALTEASYTTIRLLQAFKVIQSRDGAKYKEHLVLTLAVRGGTQVGLTPA
ncbi:putative cytochrome P450 [Bisporella sp. PMI_857]|nr:putative cytochrome P450 [Bisporella sp. PMI_857]